MDSNPFLEMEKYNGKIIDYIRSGTKCVQLFFLKISVKNSEMFAIKYDGLWSLYIKIVSKWFGTYFEDFFQEHSDKKTTEKKSPNDFVLKTANK